MKTLQETNQLPTHLIGVADSCEGQNRNIKYCSVLAVCLLHFPRDLADQVFIVSGHSFLPSGEDFGVDEKQKMKCESVFTTAEWMAIAKRTRKKHKFDVALLEARDFLGFKSLKELVVNRLCKVSRANHWNISCP